MKILVALDCFEKDAYHRELTHVCAGANLEVELVTELTDPKSVDVIIYQPSGPVQDFSGFDNLKLVQSIWAGVDKIVGNGTLNAPLCRMVDAGLAEGMREYICGHILADHIQRPKFETARNWDDTQWLPLACHKKVAMIGYGVLGQSVASALGALGFQIMSWSRKANGEGNHYNGEQGLAHVLALADYVVTLLPHTPKTEDIINAETLKIMKGDAMLINAGRGALVDEDALLEALNNGEIRGAVLDVFKSEPLPETHPFWVHPAVLVTPHIAAKSRVETACETILKNLLRLKAGEPLLYLVDRANGY